MAEQPKKSSEGTDSQKAAKNNNQAQHGLQVRQMGRDMTRNMTRFRQEGSQVAHDAEEVDQLKAMNFSVGKPSVDPSETSQQKGPTAHQIVQKKKGNPINPEDRENTTGLPNNLKAGIENLSGHSMDDVKVHRNSDKPSELNALAFAQGSEIHLGPGQEKHLPHEAWHVIQQKEGRVKPTTQLKSDISINDDSALEKEADEMGQKALQFKLGDVVQEPYGLKRAASITPPIQRYEAPLHESATRNALTADGSFSQDEASMIYYGNWMRDVNQGFVPSAIKLLGADTVYAMLNYVAYQKFGKAPTSEQMGYYILAEHLDSPVGALEDSEYATAPPKISPELESADYVNPEKTAKTPESKKTPQLSTSPNAAALPGSSLGIFEVDSSGVMGYIRRTNQHVEKRLTLAAEKGRNEEGFLHFGAAMHAIEDLFAHSNYVEIAAEEMLNGELKSMFAELRSADGNIEIQSFSPEVEVPGIKPGETDKRKVLATGSFSSLDTVESVGHEMVHMLRQPPKYPADLAEIQAMNLFTQNLAKQFNYNTNGLLRETGGAIAKQATVTLLKANAKAIELAYLLTPDAIRDAMNFINNTIHTNCLLPLADQIDSLVLESNVSKTSMVEVLESSQRIKANNGQLDDYVQPTLEMLGQNKNLQQSRMDEAIQRSALLEKTPEKAVAGPSHTQISKDHKNSVFFGLSFKLAVEADKMIKNKMLAVWGGKKADVGYQDSLSHKRNEDAYDNKKMGATIMEQGYATGEKPDLQANINETAESLNQVADLLVALNKSPANARDYLKNKQELIATSETNGANPYMENKLNSILNATNNGLIKIEQQLQPFEFNKASIDLKKLSLRIRQTKTLKEREIIYQELITLRMQFIQHITTIQKDPSFTGNKLTYAATLTAMDRAIAANAPSFTTHQINILEGKEHLKGVDQSLQGNLKVDQFKLTQQKSGNAGLDDLINTSRQIITHPKDNDWWKPLMRDYINIHQDVMKDYIKARNMGYATFRGHH